MPRYASKAFYQVNNDARSRSFALQPNNFRSTGREIGQLQTLREFDLSHPAVQAKLKERYGNRIPLTEKVISPVRMFESKELVMVFN